MALSRRGPKRGIRAPKPCARPGCGCSKNRHRKGCCYGWTEHRTRCKCTGYLPPGTMEQAAAEAYAEAVAKEPVVTELAEFFEHGEPGK